MWTLNKLKLDYWLFLAPLGALEGVRRLLRGAIKKHLKEGNF